MLTLREFRTKYPDYDDMPDDVLADSLHRKFYSDIPRADFLKQIAISPAPTSAAPVEASPVDAMLGADSTSVATQAPAATPAEAPRWFGTGTSTIQGSIAETTPVALSKGIYDLQTWWQNFKISGERTRGMSQLGEPSTTPDAAAAVGAVGGSGEAEDVGPSMAEMLAADPEYQRIRDISAGAGKHIQENTPENMTFGQEVATSVARSGASLLPSLLIGMFNPVAGATTGLATGFAQQGAQAYSETEDPAYAFRQGLYEGLGEMAGVRAIFKPAKTIIAKILSTLAVGAGQGAATQLAQDIDTILTQNKEMTLGEVLYRVGVAGASEAVLGGSIGGVMHLAEQSRQKDELLGEVESEAQRATLQWERAQRDPDAIARLVLQPAKALPEPIVAGTGPALAPGAFNVPGTQPVGVTLQQPDATELGAGAVPTATTEQLAGAYVRQEIEKMNLLPATRGKSSKELLDELSAEGATTPITPIPDASHDYGKLHYLAGMQDPNSPEAKRFIDELKTPEAKKLAREYVTGIRAAASLELEAELLRPHLHAMEQGFKYGFGLHQALDYKVGSFQIPLTEPLMLFRIKRFEGKTIDATTDKAVKPGTTFLATDASLSKPGEVSAFGFTNKVLAERAITLVKRLTRKIIADAPHIRVELNDPKSSAFGTARGFYSDGSLAITLNQANLARYIGKHIPTAAGAEFDTLLEVHMEEILTHEVGHHIGSILFERSTPDIQRAVLKAWQTDTEAALNMTEAEFVASRRGVAVQQLANASNNYSSRLHVRNAIDDSHWQYLLNFDEWMAHNFERISAGDVYGWQKPVRKFLLQAFEALRKLFNQYKVTAPNATFKKFLDMHIALMHERTAAEIEAAVQVKQMEAALGGVSNPQAQGQPPEMASQLRDELDRASELITDVKPGEMASTIGKIFRASGVPVSDSFSRELDDWGWWKRISFNVLQAARANPHIRELYDPLGQRDPVTGEITHGYVDYKLRWHKLKMYWASRADERLRQWRELSTKESEAVATFMFEQRETGKFFDLKDPLVLKKYNMTPATIELVQKQMEDYQAFLSNIEEVRLAEARQRLKTNPFVAAEIANIQKTFEQMRNTPYAPEVRFGKYIVRVVASEDIVVDGQTIKAGRTIERQHVETERAQRKLAAKLAKEYSGHLIKTDLLIDGIESLVGMPKSLLEALRTELQLDEKQSKALDDYLYKTAPSRSFVKRLMRRQGVRGYSFDLQRAYAQYFQHGSNHLARIQYGPRMRDAIQRLGLTATGVDSDLVGVVQDANKRRAIQGYLERDYDYAMNPTNDWAGARATIAVLYMGAMIKTALVNTTQVAFNTYPELAKQYNDAAAIGAITGAYKDLNKMYHVLKPMGKVQNDAINKWVQGESLTPSEESFVRKWSGLTSSEREALVRAQRENVIDQSQAMELAAMSEGNWMHRFRATSELGYYARTGAQAIMIPFQWAELMNRRVSFLAAYRLAEQTGLPSDVAYQKAVDTVRLTQGEYSKTFRPEMLRGKKGLFMMFMQYQLNQMYFATNGYSNKLNTWQWRWWAIMLMVGGLLGLPFAENLKDLAEWAMMKAFPNKKVNSKYELQEALKDFAEKLHVSPDVFLHGLSRFGFGIVPFADLSGSFSMGRLLPLTDVFRDRAAGMDWDTTVTKAVTEVGGASTTLVMRVLAGLASNDPDTWRRLERGFPLSAAQNASAAMRWYYRGGEEDSAGAIIKPFDSNDPWQAAEMAGKALAFTPRSLSEVRDELAIRRDFARYYEVRREMLLNSLNEARAHGDNEAQSQAMEAIMDYNKQVPSPVLAITGQAIRQSLKYRAKHKALVESGMGASKADEIIRQEIEAGRF